MAEAIEKHADASNEDQLSWARSSHWKAGEGEAANTPAKFKCHYIMYNH